MAKRNANGEGTIYRRKDGRYEIALFSPTTSGQIKRIRAYASSRSEADRKLTELKARVLGGVPAPDRNWRLGDYLDYWLREIIRPNRRELTYDKYESIVRLYLKPGLDKIQLSQLTVPRLQLFLNRLYSNGTSAANIAEIRKILSAALTRAMKEELLGRNVARLVDLPKHTSPKIVPWSFAEAAQFLRAAHSDTLYAAFMLSLLYGLRRGEALGLRWGDIDFAGGILSVHQQLQRSRGSLKLSPTKTEQSERDLRLHQDAAAELARHRDTQTLLREQAGTFWPWESSENELLFTTRTGRPIEPRNYNRSFHRICEQHGIRRIRVHDMRHTLATLADEALVSPKDVQYTLGHTKLSTTIGTYQHSTLASSSRVVDQLAVMILPGDTEINSLDAHLDNVEKADDSSAGSNTHGLSPPDEVVGRSRQTQPSASFGGVSFATFTSDKGTGICMSDPRLTISKNLCLSERVQGVEGAIFVWRRQWLLGLVAVMAAVKVFVSSRL